MSASWEASIRRLAARQHGLFTADDLTAAGLDRHVTTRRLRTGIWEQTQRGVYRFGGHPPSCRQDLLAAVLFNGPGAVASHRAAAFLLELPGFGREPVIEISKPRGRNQRRRDVWEHGSLWLPRSHVTVLDSVPVTTAARTIFDLAGTVHPKRAERALENALSKGMVTNRSLLVVFDDLARRGRRGTVLMRELLEARGEGYVASNSALEALGRRVLREGHLPQGEFEVNLGAMLGGSGGSMSSIGRPRSSWSWTAVATTRRCWTGSRTASETTSSWPMAGECSGSPGTIWWTGPTTWSLTCVGPSPAPDRVMGRWIRNLS